MISFEDPYTKALMEAAKALLACHPIAFLAGEHLDSDGWLDYYTHEPLESLVTQVRDVVTALKPFAHAINGKWEWRLFAPDGHLACYSDGRKLDDDCVPIDGTNMLQPPGPP